MKQAQKDSGPEFKSSPLRFRTEAQRDLIRKAAKATDQSMNSFIRSAAEKAALRVLGKAGGA